MKKMLMMLSIMFGVLIGVGIQAAVAAPIVPVKITCKSDKGKEFVSYATNCDPASQQAACDKYQNDPTLKPSKPTACKTYTTKDEFLNCLTKDPRFPGPAKSYALECKLNTGQALRVPVEDCSDTQKNSVCPSNSGTVVACKDFGSTWAVNEFTSEWLNQSEVICEMEGGNKIPLLIRDCNADTKVKACNMVSAKPIDCGVPKDIEKMRKEKVAADLAAQAKKMAALSVQPC